MNVIICGSSTQIEQIKRCLRTDITVYDSFDATKDDSTVTDSVFQDAVYIADEEQATFLKKMNIPDNSIIRYDWFPQTYFENPIEGFSDKHNALMLGMSHSQCAIDIEELSRLSGDDYCYFKESAPSLDLFLHKRFFEKLVQEHAESVHNLKRVIIEIPYYIFNYDLSLFGEFAYTKLNYFELVKDYHHLMEKPEAKRKINTFKQYWDICEKAIYEQPKPRKLPGYLIPAKRVYHIYKAMRNDDKVWREEYKKTIQENVNIWEALIADIRNNCPCAELFILVMPFNPAFRISHKAQVEQCRKTFYSCLGNIEGLTVIDEFDFVKKASLFQDHCHLNENGGKKYTEHLAKGPLS